MIPFLYILLCFNLESRSKYRLDLIFDFLTAISCALVCQQEKYKVLSSTIIEDKEDRIIFNLSDESCEYFYEVQYYSIEQQLKEYDTLTKEELIKSSWASGMDYNLTSHSIGNFLNVFLYMMEDVLSEKELEEIFELKHDVIKTYPYTTKYASDIYVSLLDSLTKARAEFISQFDVLGMSEERLLSTLKFAYLHSREVLLSHRKK